VHEHLPCVRLVDCSAVAASLIAWGYAPPAGWTADFLAASGRLLAGGGGAGWAAAQGQRQSRVTAARLVPLLRFAAAAEGSGSCAFACAEERRKWCDCVLSGVLQIAAAPPSGNCASTSASAGGNSGLGVPGGGCSGSGGSGRVDDRGSDRGVSDPEVSAAVALTIVQLPRLAATTFAGSVATEGEQQEQQQQEEQQQMHPPTAASLQAWAAQLPDNQRRRWRRLLALWPCARRALASDRLSAAADDCAVLLSKSLWQAGAEEDPSQADRAVAYESAAAGAGPADTLPAQAPVANSAARRGGAAQGAAPPQSGEAVWRGRVNGHAAERGGGGINGHGGLRIADGVGLQQQFEQAPAFPEAGASCAAVR
jgi:hypothetical protein